MSAPEKPLHPAYVARWDWLRFVCSLLLEAKSNACKVVAWAIAYSINRDSGRAFRSQQGYAAMCGISVKQVGNMIKVLRQEGLIKDHASCGHKGSFELLRLDEVPAAVAALDEKINRQKVRKGLRGSDNDRSARDCGGRSATDCGGGTQSIADNLTIYPKGQPKEADEESDEEELKILIQGLESTGPSEIVTPRQRNDRSAGVAIENCLNSMTDLPPKEYIQRLHDKPAVRRALVRRCLAGALDSTTVEAVAMGIGVPIKQAEGVGG